MVAPHYHNGWAFQAVRRKFLADAALLRDQCESLRNATQQLDPNSPFTHIFNEFIARAERDILVREKLAMQTQWLAIHREDLTFEAHARGEGLTIDF